MNIVLVNPCWTFEGSTYFGCREPHLPLEYGYARALLERAGHVVTIVDGQLEGLSREQLTARVAAMRPDMTVVTTAPSYLFWRCAPPELRVPIATVRDLRAACASPPVEARSPVTLRGPAISYGGASEYGDASEGVGARGSEPGVASARSVARSWERTLLVAVGPHGSSTPTTTLRKLGADVVVLGECEEILVALAEALETSGWASETGRDDLGVVLAGVPSICYWREGVAVGARGSAPSRGSAPGGPPAPSGNAVVQGAPHASNMQALPPLRWPAETIAHHGHHHHRFDRLPTGPGAEIEFSRGCPYRCTFCAKENFRNTYRKRPLPVVLEELDGLIAAGVTYVYFIDEIFLPDRPLLHALIERQVQFGVQTRIDLWDAELLALLGQAGCVSIEAGVESITDEGRRLLDKRCKLSTQELEHRLIVARRHVPFVQANLLDAGTDDPAAIESWRARLLAHNVWANKPVPLFPYPGSPDYTRRWGAPDARAWERAHEHYLHASREFSDIQEAHPLPLPVLEGVVEMPDVVGARSAAPLRDGARSPGLV